MRTRPLALLLTAGLIVAAACTSDDGTGAPSSTAPATSAPVTSTTAPAEVPPLEVALVWHQHQPRYPLVDGVVTRPWVRMHAAKDYLDMVRLVERFPELRVTFNLTPSLLTQLQAISDDGAQDRYEALTRVPADQLTPADRQFVLDRFFDVSPKVIARFPRFEELADRDRATFTADDVRDLQALFNLAWTDPSFLADEPLAALVAKGRGFSEADKAVILAEHRRLVSHVIPEHAAAWASGQIELTTTPLAHPILPLVANTGVAVLSDPQAVLPDPAFKEYLDAKEQVDRGLALAEQTLGKRPAGMWPGEGAVGQDVMKIFSDAGVTWVATSDDVLARSLGRGSFGRNDQGDVTDPTTLYRPYSVQASPDEAPVAVFFRDTRLSDLIGFEYSGDTPQEAVEDLLARLARIREALAASGDPGPFVVPIILDGENAWENYADDGIPFLTALYTALTTTPWLRTTTPSQFLADHPGGVRPLGAPLAAGSWIGGTLTTWIGEEEERRAWDYLRRTRQDLRRAEQQGAPQAALTAATEAMLWAEGSDWFWWYGTDQDSGDDGYFDGAFRELLGQVYDALGRDRPAFVAVPITTSAAVDATVDDAGAAALSGPAGTVRVTVGDDGLTVAVTDAEGAPVEVYLGAPRGGDGRGSTIDGRLLGFWATQALRFDPADPSQACLAVTLPTPATKQWPRCETIRAVATSSGDGFTATVPLAALKGLQSGDRLYVRLATPVALTPDTRPGLVTVPDIGGFDVVLDLTDPTGDDHGPGRYTYPTDPVFVPGAFDLTRFQLGTAGDGENRELVLVFDVAAAVANPWNSPTGLSVQTFDVYLDVDPGAGTGDRELLGGRNAVLPDGDGWEAAVTIEGWTPKVVRVGADGARSEDKPTMAITVLREQGRVIARIPMAALGLTGDPTTWGVAVAVLSQEGYPSAGVDRVRDVQPVAAQYKIGGGTGSPDGTRILDALATEPGRQEALLSASPAVLALHVR